MFVYFLVWIKIVYYISNLENLLSVYIFLIIHVHIHRFCLIYYNIEKVLHNVIGRNKINC